MCSVGTIPRKVMDCRNIFVFLTIISIQFLKISVSQKWETHDSAGIFKVTRENGFLPFKRPLGKLPEKYNALELLLQEMPVIKKDGKTGMLGLNKLGESVQSLPIFDLSAENDTRVLSALFRDYTFLASAYIFEPCYHNLETTGEMGLARHKIPKNIAQPLAQLSDRFKVRPFFDYAYSYALVNWKVKDENGGMDFDNLELIRSFAGHPSESGFILVHVLMNQFSGKLVSGAIDYLNSVEAKNDDQCELAMECLLDTMRHINKEMETMWTRNQHKHYGKFRVFLFGSKNQLLLPNGLIYEGVNDEPKFYRGESGACDSIIPLMDNILELTLEMPDNELTEILRDFRSCRPEDHKNFLKWAEERATRLKVKEFALSTNPTLFLKLLDQVREIRTRHWNFARVYIMQHTRYPVATGGSPMVKWLPNQLLVVHKAIQSVARNVSSKSLTERELKFSAKLLRLSETESASLQKQIKEFGVNITATNYQKVAKNSYQE